MDLYETRAAIAAGRSIRDLPLRVAFYARVSTDKEEQLHSLQNQTSYYEALIAQNGNWRFAGGFVDEGVSGGSVARRGEFLRMIACARRGELDYIITKEISRFSRDTLDSIRYTRELLDCGVGVFFENDNINTLLPDAELRLTLMASLAQDERRRLSERVRFGFRRSIERGRVLGNSRIWGYEKADGTLRVVEREAELVRRIFTYYADERMGLRAAAERLAREGFTARTGNALSASTVKNILRNPKYKGDYCGGKTGKVDYRSRVVRRLPPSEWKIEADHPAVPAIVDAALWQRANDLLDRRGAEKTAAGQPVGANVRYRYSGRIVCCCGAPYHRATDGGRELWQCRESARHGRAGCLSPNLRTDELDRVATQYFASVPTDVERVLRRLRTVFSSLFADDRTEKAQAEQTLRRCREARRRLLELTLGGDVTAAEFHTQSDLLNAQIADAERRLAALCDPRKRQRDEAELARLDAAAREALRFDTVTTALLEGAQIGFTAGGTAEERTVTVTSSVFPAAEYHIRRSRRETSVWCASYT